MRPHFLSGRRVYTLTRRLPVSILWASARHTTVVAPNMDQVEDIDRAIPVDIFFTRPRRAIGQADGHRIVQVDARAHIRAVQHDITGLQLHRPAADAARQRDTATSHEVTGHIDRQGRCRSIDCVSEIKRQARARTGLWSAHLRIRGGRHVPHLLYASVRADG